MKQTVKEKRIIKEINQLVPSVTINSARKGNVNEVNQAHFFIPTDNKNLEHILNLNKRYLEHKNEISIKDISYMIAESFEIDISKVVFDTTKSDGQYKKTVSNKKLRTILPNYKFKTLK